MSTITSAANPAGFDTVTDYLSWDHDRLDCHLAMAREHVQRGAWKEAHVSYGEFEEGLDRHIRLEEEVLFPVFEAMTGITDGPTSVMRAEHRAVRRALAIMRSGIDACDNGLFEEGFEFLGSVLPDHNVKEERVLYPTTDRILSEQERVKLVSRLAGA